MSGQISFSQLIDKPGLFNENPVFETVKSKLIISLFEIVSLSVSILPRNLYNSLKSIKENNTS